MVKGLESPVPWMDLYCLEVANGTRKIQGLGKFCSNLEILEAFSMSLEISFSCVSLRFGFSNFCLGDLRVLDFVFWVKLFI